MTLYTSPGQIKIIGTRNFRIKIYSVEDGHKLVGKRVGLLCVFYTVEHESVHNYKIVKHTKCTFFYIG